MEAGTFGKIYLTLIVSFWSYYTVWMLITPIIDADHPIQSYFPDRENGLLVTTAGAYFAMAYLCTITGIILIKDNFQTRKPLLDQEECFEDE